jgi:hypothetical protein
MVPCSVFEDGIINPNRFFQNIYTIVNSWRQETAPMEGGGCVGAASSRDEKGC